MSQDSRENFRSALVRGGGGGRAVGGEGERRKKKTERVC